MPQTLNHKCLLSWQEAIHGRALVLGCRSFRLVRCAGTYEAAAAVGCAVGGQGWGGAKDGARVLLVVLQDSGTREVNEFLTSSYTTSHQCAALSC